MNQLKRSGNAQKKSIYPHYFYVNKKHQEQETECHDNHKNNNKAENTNMNQRQQCDHYYERLMHVEYKPNDLQLLASFDDFDQIIKETKQLDSFFKLFPACAC